MSGFCDRCNERSSQIVMIASEPEFARITNLGYRQVCPACYDDLLSGAGEGDELAEDRRGEPRAKATIRVLVEGNTTHFDPFSEEMLIEEISPSGARMRTSRELDLGAILKLSIPSNDVEATAIVEVVWREAGLVSVGLKVIEPGDGWLELWRANSADE